MTVARRSKAEIQIGTGLTASAGVAPNKFLAKIASGWQKPDGLTVIAPERVEPFLQRCRWTRCGASVPSPRSKLRERGIEQPDRRARGRPRVLREAVGTLADWLQRLAHGIDDRPVIAERETRSRPAARTRSRKT